MDYLSALASISIYRKVLRSSKYFLNRVRDCQVEVLLESSLPVATSKKAGLGTTELQVARRFERVVEQRYTTLRNVEDY